MSWRCGFCGKPFRDRPPALLKRMASAQATRRYGRVLAAELGQQEKAGTTSATQRQLSDLITAEKAGLYISRQSRALIAAYRDALAPEKPEPASLGALERAEHPQQDRDPQIRTHDHGRGE